jgi:hypothetical protein
LKPIQLVIAENTRDWFYNPVFAFDQASESRYFSKSLSSSPYFRSLSLSHTEKRMSADRIRDPYKQSLPFPTIPVKSRA